MHYLDFSFNWNGKLFTHHFPTLQLWQPDRFKPQSLFRCRLKIKETFNELGTVRLLNITHLHFGELTNNMSYIDTGYNAAETKSIIAKMYKGVHEKEGNNLELGFYIFKWETRSPGWFETLAQSVMRKYDELIIAEGLFQEANAKGEFDQPIQISLGV